jgi:tRNA(Ile)-lysidine synthase TilS/MesJ
MLTNIKDRILATCEENNLEYITDATNFQPHITLRNALRHTLANEGRIAQVSRHSICICLFVDFLADRA